MYTQEVYNAVVIRSVRLSRRAEKDLERVPEHIVLKLEAWVEAVRYRLVYVERVTRHEY